jgi:hypothetical protein
MTRDTINFSDRLGNYIYHFEAEELSNPLSSGPFISSVVGVKRLNKGGPPKTIDPLPLGEGHGETKLEAHQDLEEDIHEWIRTQPDFDPDFEP